MSNIKTDWRIVKSINPKFGRWDIETRHFLKEIGEDGRATWNMERDWTRHSAAETKRAALARVMLLRERGETVSWEGGPIRLGIALIQPQR